MDDFLADLERNISNVGSTKHWKKKFGDVTLWLSPLTLRGQEALTDMLSNADKIGMNVINETKRMTLSHAIVGINEIDLRDFRDSAPKFPVKGRDGNNTNVTLDKYVYTKMVGWSSQLIDDAFSVYSDIMETHQKENLSSIQFENSKDPEVELKELETRVFELRSLLKKPQLVEDKPELREQRQEASASDEPAKPVVEVAFDPFAAVAARESEARSKTVTEVARPVSEPVAQPPEFQQVRSPQPIPDKTPEKDVSLPGVGKVKAYVANPSVQSEVVEAKLEQSVTAPPVIDPVIHNRNPRFQQQR